MPRSSQLRTVDCGPQCTVTRLRLRSSKTTRVMDQGDQPARCDRPGGWTGPHRRVAVQWAISRSEAKGRSSMTRARLAVIDVDMAAAVLGPEPLFFLTDTGFSHVDMAEAGVGSWATLD